MSDECEGISLGKAHRNLWENLKGPREGVSRPMILHSNKFDTCSICCKCNYLSAVQEAKKSKKLLQLILKVDH
jgi:hypothetical protein